MISALSRRAPTIIVLTLCAALLGYWVEVPVWFPYGIAVIVSCLAIVLVGARNRRVSPPAEDDDGSKSWITYELAGKGSPPGSYVLGFFALVTIMVTGLNGAYALPAWAALALAAAWGIANAHYPTGE